MKNRILVFLVFITTFLKGQSVDPETFPTLNSGIGLKYLYTNTGGEGKILVDSIATRVRAYWTNGVNGQDSLGLGGSIVQPTTINVDNFQTVFQKGGLSAMGFVPNGSLSEQWLLIAGSSDFRIATANTFRDTTIGNESIGCSINIKDLSGGGIQKGFSNKYYVPTNDMQSYWHFNNSVSGQSLYMSLNDNNGFVITPYDIGLTSPFAGSTIFMVNNISGNSVFSIAPNGIINEQVPSYADDADAGTNGLIQGDVYQTNGTGSAPLNIAGIRMIKQ
jgi:hypothetical protein